MADDETDWDSLFTVYATPYFGYCNSVDDANELVQEYCYRTSASFARCNKNNG